ncbi:MAG: iron-sulfur cluster assembly scaffold protein [Planctomycetes bacterium]|nr:iron-sulfur cluster assembly scaffold protein [Planctomycetota bacterium]
MTSKNSDNPLDEHFLQPRNTGVLEDADFTVRVENPVCGDLMDLHVRHGPDGRVDACRFQVYGCPAAIAAGSMLTELVVGKSCEELRALRRDDLLESLGDFPRRQVHAVHLAYDAVEAVCETWKPIKSEPSSPDEP